MKQNPNLLLIFLLVAIVFASGCISQKSETKPSAVAPPEINPPSNAEQVTPPTAPEQAQPTGQKPLKATISLVKASSSGLCLKHEGGDSFDVTRLGIKVDDQTVGIISYNPFPASADYVFSLGEYFVYAIQSPASIHVGSKVLIGDTESADPQAITRLKSNGESDYWTIEKLEEYDKSANVLVGGFASCP